MKPPPRARAPPPPVATGRRLRLLQSGLIHRELALTVMGIAVIAAVLLILPMSS